MKVLFLDTETSGLSSINDSVIEIAGVLCVFDSTTLSLEFKSQFNSLVKLDYELDPKITRITNITQSELNNSPTRSRVQILWNDWINEQIDSDEEYLICGHSIGFDIGFLKNERWFISQNASIVDTLDLCKILLPDSQAINLEFLIRKFSLDPKSNPHTKELVKSLDAHRALFDTYAAISLFEFLIQRLVSLPISKKIAETINNNFLHLPITFYEVPELIRTTEDAQTSWRISLEGEVIPASFREKIRPLKNNSAIELLEAEINAFEGADKDIIRVLLQLYILGVCAKTLDRTELRFHARDTNDFLLLETVISVTAAHHESNNSAQLYSLEDYIPKINEVSKNNYELGIYIHQLDLIQIITNTKSLGIAKLISAYDFMILSIQPLLLYSEYTLKPSDTTPESYAVTEKLKSIVDGIHNLDLDKFRNKSAIADALISQTVEFGKKLELHFSTNILIKVRKGHVTVSTDKSDFSLNSLFQNISKSFESVSINSYLPEDDINRLKRILGIQEYDNITYCSNYQPHVLQQLQSVDVSEYIELIRKNDSADPNPSLIVCGQNKAHKMSEFHLIKSLSPKDYLIVGESGSISKVISKITPTFSGIILLKSHEADYIMKSNKLNEIASITFLMPPYLFFKDYFDSLNDNQKHALKDLYIQAMFNKFFTKWHKPITFIHTIQ